MSVYADTVLFVPESNPWFSLDYIRSDWENVSALFVEHWTLALQSVAIAFLIAVPLALLARTGRWLTGFVLSTSAVLYTVPSLALFAMLTPLTGIGRTTVFIGLVVYALLVLVRNTLVGLDGVPADSVDAARGMGFGGIRLLFQVELPQAIPSIIAGVRLAAVSTIALVTVGIVVGYGGLGQLMYSGFQADYRAKITTAVMLCLLMAFVTDLIVIVVGRLLTPWTRLPAGDKRSRAKQVPA